MSHGSFFIIRRANSSYYFNIILSPVQKYFHKQLINTHYQQKATRTCNPKLTKEQLLINAAMGLCGESGEVIDHVKKWFSHWHPLNQETIAKEFEDVTWYLAEACTALDLNLDDIFEQNIEKLKKRYPNTFNTEDSLKRMDMNQ